MQYIELREAQIDSGLFSHFIRRQVVDLCRRRVDGEWRLIRDPFIDDWTEEDHERLSDDLRRTAARGGLVLGAVSDDGALRGFASVTPDPLGSHGQYLDLTHLHVSLDVRGAGVGRELFRRAMDWARRRGAEKLYISAHSAVESQAFYAAMGCVEAEEYSPAHVEAEP